MFGHWPALMDGSQDALLRAAGEVDDFADAAAVGRLRKLGSASVVRAAIALVTARRKAIAKFDHADALAADPVGVEQATSIDIARHKAQRFVRHGAGLVADLCCGIGGDAMGLAEAGIGVVAVDRDPPRAWMARHNARCEAVVADVARVKIDGRWFHIDPDRRADGRRRWRYEAMQPGPAVVERLARAARGGAAKLSPAIDPGVLGGGEIEFIARRGGLVQAVWWTGELAEHERSATVIDARGAATLSGAPGTPPTDAPGRYLLAVDAAVERAELMETLSERLDAPAIHPALGLLRRDALDFANDAMRFVTPFELIERMAWREKRVRQWLAGHDGGIVEVKTRGGAVDTDAAQRALRGEGATPYTVFVLRFDRRVEAWVTRRIEKETPDAS